MEAKPIFKKESKFTIQPQSNDFTCQSGGLRNQRTAEGIDGFSYIKDTVYNFISLVVQKQT